MGIQNDFTTDEPRLNDGGSVNRTMETVNYIADLLGELSTIANISGLNNLSNDIDTLLSKHAVASA